MKYSVTSVILPKHNLLETCKLVKDAGYEGIEWRVRPKPEGQEDKPSFWGYHRSDLSPENILKRAPELTEAMKDHGLAIAAFASNCRADQLEEIKRIAEGAAACNCPLIRVTAPRGYDGTVLYPELFEETVEAYGKALDITRQYKVKVIIETHVGTIFVSLSLAHRLVSNFSSEDIGVIYDLQNQVRDGYETPGLVLDLLGPYVVHAHIGGHKLVPQPADEKGTVRWDWPAVDLGEGIIDHAKVLVELKRIGYQGFLSLEDFREDIADEDKLKRAIDYLHKIDPDG